MSEREELLDWAALTAVGLFLFGWGLQQTLVVASYGADHWRWLTSDPEIIDYFRFWLGNHGLISMANGAMIAYVSATAYRNRERWAWWLLLYVPMHLLLLTTQLRWLLFATLPLAGLLGWILWRRRSDYRDEEWGAASLGWILFLPVALGLLYFAYDNVFVIPALDSADADRGWTWLTDDPEVLDYIKFCFRVFGIQVFGLAVMVSVAAGLGLRGGHRDAWWALIPVPALAFLLTLRWPWTFPITLAVILLSGAGLWVSARAGLGAGTVAGSDGAAKEAARD